MRRRDFNRQSSHLLGVYLLLGIAGCKRITSLDQQDNGLNSPWKLSLAQWSLHRNIQSGRLPILDFAKMASTLGFQGLEYVSQLYLPYRSKYGSVLQGMKALSKDLMDASDQYSLENLIVMVDEEGDLATSDSVLRVEHMKNHYKWIDLISAIGGHGIRVNLFGHGNVQSMTEASVESLTSLATYAQSFSIDILVENHGGFSSDPEWLIHVIKSVGMDNVGLLPDFGNFCIRRKDGDRWGSPCVEEYPDKVSGVELMMPYAKGVSAKSYAFDQNGNETTIDYQSMMDVIKQSGYTGYIGVEYEGQLDEIEGIKLTKSLLEKSVRRFTH